jgi:hypothetical protein
MSIVDVLFLAAEQPNSAPPTAGEPLKHEKPECGRRLLPRLCSALNLDAVCGSDRRPMQPLAFGVLKTAGE